MRYWGETDQLYNMVIYSAKTNLAYFTHGAGDSVDIIKPSHDAQNILQGTWFATINSDGSVKYSQVDSGEPPLKNKSALYVGIGIVVALLLSLGLVLVFRRKTAQS